MDWWWEKKKKKKKKRALERGATLLEELIECCDGKSNPIKFFSDHQIRKATDNFSNSNHVAGRYLLNGCEWYSGKNENHPMILIRRGVAVNGNLYRDIAVSSMVSGHKNFMKLVGCSLESEYNPVLVYNAEKPHVQVHEIISIIPWKWRMKIAEDIATALAYLHTAFPRPFVYRSLSPEKILLDKDSVAKLTDFSDCVSIPKGETLVKINRIYCGDVYKDSKYWRNGVVSVETDVYAFGMLMQMFLHGCHEVWVGQLSHRIIGTERADDSIIEKEAQKRQIQEWLLKLMEEGRMDEIAHPKMLEEWGEISEEELCQMKAFLMLSQRCISEVEVPTMVEVAKELKKIQRSLKNDSSSSSGETQEIASSSSQTRL